MKRDEMNLIEQKFGKLTVLGKSDSTQHNEVWWDCVCECGYRRDINTYRLISGDATCCRRCSKLKPREDLVGQKFNNWTVISLEENPIANKHIRWLCICGCGNTCLVRQSKLKNGESKNCKKCGATQHGQTYTKTYESWCGMLRRCNCVTDDAYPNYGARGIKVCEKWSIFVNFLDDMGHKPDGSILDRKNNDLGYYKENCHWTDYIRSGRNRRSVKASMVMAREIRKKHKEGFLNKELSQEYNLSPTLISSIIHNHTWKEDPPILKKAA